MLLEPWTDADLGLERLFNTPEMTAHNGGPRPDEEIVARHHRYLALPADGEGQIFRVHLPGEPEPVGSIGYWTKEWRGEPVYEMGWMVLPGHQGRGIATAATVAAAEHARVAGKHRSAHAFPPVANTASNAICRKAGFKLVEECEFEYPKGNFLRCNDWRLFL
ncbi:RimJ/RimL family protein N-acetyltransferase [Herbihabitans rhizosphaerae]|uniref:RimJ/RimL family protein N-acetyltransferase n=1 Tax=Herbihabitans rhizosphaerae TaxID=1872711 RepID=A0A4Q7L913_9PSEU|nr:RimJ/RimL family protein N-acetyltransferase [Herbihabitans rhizosphaerae]